MELQEGLPSRRETRQRATTDVMSPFALYYVPDAYSLKGKVMGRQSAGVALLRAAANTRPDRLWCYARSRADAQTCAQEFSELGSPRTGVAWVPFLEPQRLGEAGLLYRPDPGIEQDAWRRLAYSRPDAYSLCGITHTTASHAVMETLSRLPAAPLESWDALICTSRAVRDSVRVLIENQVAYLRERVGATRFSLPQLPVIPLGVHVEQFAVTPDARFKARAILGLRPDETAVLFAGRLSFHGKAHPAPLYLSLEANARANKIVLIQAGWFANDAIEKAFKADAAKLCPSVRCLYVDGRQQDRLREAFAASDIFTSLSDNIQETFGLTPLEAMAAGLPSVVTDWDGYRDTVRDGIDGYRVPTLAIPNGTAGDLAERYDMGLDSYDYYCAYTSQLAAVDVEATTQAFRQLIEDRDLRARMGAAAQKRARTEFDWSVIFRRYLTLWDELGERRRSEPRLGSALTRRRRPERDDPFAVFASYATRNVQRETRFEALSTYVGVSAADMLALDTVSFARAVLPPEPYLNSVLTHVRSNSAISAKEIHRATEGSWQDIVRTLAWLSKMGLIRAVSG